MGRKDSEIRSQNRVRTNPGSKYPIAHTRGEVCVRPSRSYMMPQASGIILSSTADDKEI
jgi:hypothetical protein